MINCHYCDKEVIPNRKGNITVAFIEQTRMTINFPFCNKQCHRDLMIERGYDKPKTKREKEFIKICLADGWDEQFVNPNEHFKAGVQFMKERIIKNAGKELLE